MTEQQKCDIARAQVKSGELTQGEFDAKWVGKYKGHRASIKSLWTKITSKRNSFIGNQVDSGLAKKILATK